MPQLVRDPTHRGQQDGPDGTHRYRAPVAWRRQMKTCAMLSHGLSGNFWAPPRRGAHVDQGLPDAAPPCPATPPTEHAQLGLPPPGGGHRQAASPVGSRGEQLGRQWVGGGRRADRFLPPEAATGRHASLVTINGRHQRRHSRRRTGPLMASLRVSQFCKPGRCEIMEMAEPYFTTLAPPPARGLTYGPAARGAAGAEGKKAASQRA